MSPEVQSDTKRGRFASITALAPLLLALGPGAVMAIAFSSPAGAESTIAGNMKTENLDKLTGGLAWYATLICVCGILISAAMWALGAKGQNAGTELIGKKGLIVCCTAAFFIGATPGLINWLDDKAKEADESGVTDAQPYNGGAVFGTIPQGGSAVGGGNNGSADKTENTGDASKPSTGAGGAVGGGAAGGGGGN